MSNKGQHKRVCIVGAGPSGMSALYQFAKLPNPPELVCLEKQGTWGGMCNYTWLTGTDQYGEPCHNSMYRGLWSNGPKECLEYPDYTFEKHFGKAVPSYPPRTVMRDYLEGRFKNCSTNLKKIIKFHTVVKNIRYLDDTDEFSVTWQDLESSVTSTELFSHVIIATGIFTFPNKPVVPGLDTFPGRVLHSHDFRAPEEFKGQNILVVGARYSAEDIPLQTMKFGAKSVVCSWRTKPMGFKWPKGIEERPLLQRVEGNLVHFKDGSSARFDSIIFCTGYVYHFPYLEDRLRITSKLSVYPENLYKGTVWLNGGNNKLFYMGIQDQYFSFSMFDVVAVWITSYIMGMLKDEPKSLAAMKTDAKNWVSKREAAKDCYEEIDVQTAYIADLCTITGYDDGVTKGGQMFHDWEDDKIKGITTFRDKCFTSAFSGTKSPPLPKPWMECLDDSIEFFVGK